MQENRDTKPWAGQIYFSHTSEIVCKLLYKKFFRKTDCTILHGQWKHILLEQQRAHQSLTSDDNDLPNTTKGEQRDETAHPSPVIPLQLHRIRTSASCPQNLDKLTDDAPPSPHIFSSTARPVSPLYTRHSTAYKNLELRERNHLVASSRHGFIAPENVEAFQCFVLFYTSSWSVPHSKSRRLKRIFGPELVPRIEAYIRDEFNGEQSPGTSFVIETGSTPCRFIVCTSISRNQTCLSADYAYNALRASLLAIHKHNKTNPTDQITSILCPALEAITLPPYNMVHQMATCYEYWDWHMYAHGAVLPFTHEDEEYISKQITMTTPSSVRIAQDLEQYVKAGLLVSRGLVYESELQIILGWLNSKNEKSKEKTKRSSGAQIQTDIPKFLLAQVVVDVLKRPDFPPFTLTPSQICSGIIGSSLDCILQLAKDSKIKIYDEIKPQDLRYGNLVAPGSTGKVYEAEWGDMEVAVKMFFDQPQELFMQELTMITLVRHPKLVEAIGGYCDHKSAYIVTELMDMNLFNLLADRHTDMSFQMKLKIAIDIAQAMEFLHSRNIVHRDLKSVNVLLNRDTMVAKVCDFGLSRVIDSSTSTLTENVGTTGWIAPEIFNNKRYSDKCDVYSFGIVLYELLTRSLPFKEIASYKIPDAVIKRQRPAISPETTSQTPKEYMDLMKQCWHDNPQKRPSFCMILPKLLAMVDTTTDEIPTTPKFEEEDEDISLCSSSDDEDSTKTPPHPGGSVLEKEKTALDQLKVLLKRARHPLITDELLLKCLRARHLNIMPSKHLVSRYIEWYHLLTNGKPIKISDVRKTLDSKVLYFVDGALDKDERNIIFWDLSNYDVDVTPEPVLMRTLVYCLERATERPEIQTKGVIVVANMANWSMAHISMRIVNSFFGTMRKYFPVIVPRILLVNSPGWAFKVLTMYQSFISSTMDVIELVTQQKLLEYVTAENMVPTLQGTFQFDMERWIRKRYEIENVEYM